MIFFVIYRKILFTQKTSSSINEICPLFFEKKLIKRIDFFLFKNNTFYASSIAPLNIITNDQLTSSSFLEHKSKKE